MNWVRFTYNGINSQTPTPTVTPTVTTVPPTNQGVPLPAPVPFVYGSGVVPGVIQAEDFNTGGEGVGYYDTTSSNFGGIYRTGEDVDIELNDGREQPRGLLISGRASGSSTRSTPAETGDYDVVYRVSSPQSNTQIRMQVDGVTATTFTVPNTGSYDTYTNVTQKVRLTFGPHVLRLTLRRVPQHRLHGIRAGRDPDASARHRPGHGREHDGPDAGDHPGSDAPDSGHGERDHGGGDRGDRECDDDGEDLARHRPVDDCLAHRRLQSTPTATRGKRDRGEPDTDGANSGGDDLRRPRRPAPRSPECHDLGRNDGS